MAIQRSAKLILPLFVLACLPVFAQFSNRPNDSTNLGPNYIPDGTRFIVKLDDTLDSNKVKPGKKFTAKLAEDLTTPGGATIPAGKKLHGHISDVDQGMHGRILISWDEIETRHGWRPLVASISDVPGEKGVKPVDEEGGIEKKGHNSRRTMEAAAIGAAAGAGTGAIAGGGRGAVIGAAAGAGVGLVGSMLTDRDLKLNKGTQLELRLDRPLQVPAN